MHEQDLAIVRALVPVAWADGDFAEKERESIEALLDAYGATEDEKKSVRDYAKEKRNLDDIDLQELSADDRRVLLQHAVLLCHADGDYSADEKKFIDALTKKLKVPEAEAKPMIEAACARAEKLIKQL
jgi:tellurite resistance protein